jgi:hypothetical protein
LKIQKPSLQIEKKKRLQFEGCHGADQMPWAQFAFKSRCLRMVLISTKNTNIVACNREWNRGLADRHHITLWP